MGNLHTGSLCHTWSLRHRGSLSRFSAIVIAIALSLTACGGDEGATVSGVTLVKKGQLTTCTNLPYPPFQLEQSGQVVGFDIDMVGLVAKGLGVPQKIIDTPFETIKGGAALNGGKCDVAAAGMSIKPERAKFIDFSIPYFNAAQALMAKRGSGISSLDDVRKRKLKLGALAGSTGEDIARARGFDPRSFDNAQAQLDALRTGQVDVIVQDDPVVRYWLRDTANRDLALVAALRTDQQYGFAVRKDHNPTLLRLINETIERAKRDGTYKRIYEKWMGPMPSGIMPS
jgi:polar amino acid transport system substrate-binding protein